MLDRIITEEEGFMVVDKPAGVLSQKDKSGDPDLADLIKAESLSSGKKYPFLAPVHRLDRNTSGLILLAKTPQSAKFLTSAIQLGKIKRTYIAIAKGDPGESGRYDFPLKKNERTNEVFVDSKGDEAITYFHRIRNLGNSSLMRVRLQTGRSHQIRVHFSHAGHALLGDKKYAKKPWSEIYSRPALHAAEIEFPIENVGKVFHLSAPPPQDFLDLLTKLSGSAALS